MFSHFLAGVSIKAGYQRSTTACRTSHLHLFGGHSRLLNLQWPLITSVIETPALSCKKVKRWAKQFKELFSLVCDFFALN